MSEHVWSQENIAAYVAGGLDATERERLEQHLAGCSECAREVESARALERRLEPLFRAARPGPALEDRLIRALPDCAAKSHRSLRLMFRSLSGRAKLALAAAAALLLMALGAGISEVLDDEPRTRMVAILGDASQSMGEDDRVPVIGVGTGTMAEYRTKQKENGIVKSADELAGEIIETSKEILKNGQTALVKVPVAKRHLGTGVIVRQPEDAFEFKQMPANSVPKNAITDLAQLKNQQLRVPRRPGEMISSDELVNKDSPGIATHLPEGYRAVGQTVNMDSISSGFASLPMSRVDVIHVSKGNSQKDRKAQMLLENVLVLSADTQVTRDEEGRAKPASVLTFALTPEDALKLETARQSGSISVALRKYGDQRKLGPNSESEEMALNRPPDQLPKIPDVGGDVRTPINGFSFLPDKEDKKEGQNESKSREKLSETRKPQTMKVMDPGATNQTAYQAALDAVQKEATRKLGKDKTNNPPLGAFNAFGGTVQSNPSTGFPGAGGGGGFGGQSSSETTANSGSGSGAGANPQAGEISGKKKEIAWNSQSNKASKEPGAYFMWDANGKPAETKKAPIGGPGRDLPAFSMPVPNSALPPSLAPPVATTNGNIPIPPEIAAKLGEKDKESKKGPAPYPELRIQEANLSQSKILELPPSDPSVPTQTKPATQATPKTDPVQTPRKVILRSGELEFEVESFDAAVAAIMKLVNATKGGFIATINSEKLPNGKVRGSVVVRVPPEQLDGLVLDLRRDLGKQGELKNQRIGSQDVTKQYTDLESKLRASRTMEDRLLNIIKEGKGQIKDLLLAEKELGVWRTQIEEIEGELRYYSNLATLSTLTLKLHEKNIRSAASITENERIQAGLEVEEVEKAFKDALKIVDEAKGRITRSELKQQSAGQFNAVLHFEVAPDAAGPVRDLLRQLGTMVRLQIDRVQQPGDGGAPPPKDGKIERGNTQFQVSIYNLANIAPRETVILRIAASDVPAAYRKLRDVIAKAKGHVVNAQLNEEDKQKINAQLDFNVRRVAEGEILAALAATGETMTRQVNRVPDADGFTDSKVLFRLSLVDADFIQPRETVTMRIAADDVKAAYNKLRAVLAQAKTRVINADLNEKDKRNISAQFDFTFARTEEGVLRTALALLGETLSHQVTRLADTNNVTDTKVLARIEVVQLDNIQPRETLFVNIAAADVRQSYLKLQEELAKLKANIINADINEKDRQNVRAALDFTIRRTDEPAVQTILSAAGESLSRQSARLADNGNLTDTKVLIRVELFQTDSLPPRETVSLKIAAVDVPAAYQSLRTAVAQAKGRETKAELNENDRRNATGLLIFDVPRAAEPALQTLLANLGETLSRQVLRKEETIGVTNAKVGFQIDLKPAALISPRETVTLALEVSNAKAVSDLLTLFNADVTEAKGQVVQTQIGQQRNGQVSAHIVYDVPLTALATLADKFRTFGQVRVHQVERDPQAPEGKLALGRIVVTISNADLLFPTDHGLGSEIRRGFTRSLTGLLRSVSWLFISVFFILPWALLAYAIVWVVRRMMGYGRGAKTVATSPPTPAA